jgi:HEPN domain-containing protein
MEYKIWLQQANRDLEVAHRNHNNKDYYVVAFFCQQSVEKALYLRKFRKLLKIHDLVKLAREVHAPGNIIKFCSRITPVYMEVRYPESDELPADKVSKQEAENLLQIS